MNKVETVFVHAMMENLTHGYGSFECRHYDLKNLKFTFTDIEDDKIYRIGMADFEKAMPLVRNQWPKGCSPIPAELWLSEEAMDDYVTQFDAIDHDCFLQLVIFGEVIYG
jgi:hypothetical protein